MALMFTIHHQEQVHKTDQMLQTQRQRSRELRGLQHQNGKHDKTLVGFFLLEPTL